MSDSRTKALMIAGQCWCDPETSGIEVDARLANSFADRVVPLLDDIERLRLTDAEREAVQVARDAYADDDGNAECEEIAAVLSGLLERTKQPANTRDQQPRTKEAANMNDENERSVASDGSVTERPLGDPEVAVEILKLRVAELEQAIRRLADQDATLSLLCKRDGSQVVTVTMDATLTGEEREAVERAADWLDRWQQTHGYHSSESGDLATLRALLERMK